MLRLLNIRIIKSVTHRLTHVRTNEWNLATIILDIISILSPLLVPDDPECEAVEDDEEQEGDESHHHEVGDEEIVSAVSVAVPQLGGAHLSDRKCDAVCISMLMSITVLS